MKKVILNCSPKKSILLKTELWLIFLPTTADHVLILASNFVLIARVLNLDFVSLSCFAFNLLLVTEFLLRRINLRTLV